MAQQRSEDFRRKIVTPEALRDSIGARPRAKSVIMCHGTFDVVHPGHVRHLMYAHEKADILVASLTCDDHITKANFRPFVPEQLRAMNLAAFEFVDYVIIDRNPTPLENLKLLQPDYFAKGYDYFSRDLHPKTREEVAVLDSYGGELIFTPGDVVYSSSAFLEQAPPRIAVEKLMVLMDAEGVSFDRLRATLGQFGDIKVHVLGDTIVDSYTYCTLIGGTAKTPTFSVKHERQVDFSGGAAVVSKHIRRAGAHVKFSTVMGNDDLKEFVTADLQAHGIDCDIFVDSTRPTTQKNAFIAGGYRLLKVDKVDNRRISDRVVEHFCASLQASQVDACVFSDFRHGIFNRETIPDLTSALPKGAFTVADSQVASRWGNILEFQGFGLITPNEKEARFALGDQDNVIRPLGLSLYEKAKCGLMIMKLGQRGAIVYRPHRAAGDVRGFFTLDSFAENVVDAVGAGDALLAYATLGYVASKSDAIAAILGSLAAAVACEHDGNNPVAPEDVLKKLAAIEKQVQYA